MSGQLHKLSVCLSHELKMFNRNFLLFALLAQFCDAFPNTPRMVATRVTTVTDFQILTGTRIYFPTCYVVPDDLPICKARKRSLEEKIAESVLIHDHSQQIKPSVVQSVEITRESPSDLQAPTQVIPQVESSHSEAHTLGVPASEDLCQGRYFLLTHLSTVTAKQNSTVYVTETARNTVSYSLEGCKEPGAIYSPICEP